MAIATIMAGSFRRRPEKRGFAEFDRRSIGVWRFSDIPRACESGLPACSLCRRHFGSGGNVAVQPGSEGFRPPFFVREADLGVRVPALALACKACFAEITPRCEAARGPKMLVLFGSRMGRHNGGVDSSVRVGSIMERGHLAGFPTSRELANRDRPPFFVRDLSAEAAEARGNAKEEAGHGGEEQLRSSQVPRGLSALRPGGSEFPGLVSL